MITPSTYDFICIGCENADGYPVKCVPIRQGTNIDQRIGAKIRPVSLRCFGTITIENRLQEAGPVINGLSSIVQVNACMLRVMIIQVRNGNTDHTPLGVNFSAVNPSIVTTSYVQDVGDRPIRSYNGQEATYYCNVDWFGKMFSTTVDWDTSSVYNQQRNAVEVYEGLNVENRFKWGVFTKAPYRNGIGASVKILKDKVYNLNPTVAPTFGFRFKTKRPYRMVWKESRTQDNELTTNCRNPIYIIFIPIYPVGVNVDKICVNFNCQLYYTDK